MSQKEEENLQFTCDLEVKQTLWANFLGLCEQGGLDALTEIQTCLEEYIASVKEEFDSF